MPYKNLEKYLTKIDRLAAWILLFAFILFMVSGYGLTRGLISRSLSRALHVQYLPLVIIITFIVHVGLALRMTLIRWQVWGRAAKIILVVCCLVFLGFFSYVELFYQEAPRVRPEPAEDVPSEDILIAAQPEPEPVFDKEGLRLFTREDLSYYDGREGRPAYVAVDGKVYDNTAVFTEGEHYSHYAGQELTGEFYSYHIIEEMADYPVVGRLVE